MRIDKRVFQGGAVAAMTLVAWSGSYTASSAVQSWNGDDYSYEYNARQYLRVCDKESDSTPVNGKYDDDLSGGHIGSIKDTDGPNGECASENSGTTIARHQTCETPDFLPDPCGNWQATEPGK